MPIYEYRCRKCGHKFDMMQKMSDDCLQRCEKCGDVAERLISRTSFMLKGSGWYATDYAGKKAHGKEAEKDSAPSPCDQGCCQAGACSKVS